MESPLRIGYVFEKVRVPESAWSGTPHAIHMALKRRTDIELVELPMRASPFIIKAARLLGARRVRNQWRTNGMYFMMCWKARMRAFQRATKGADVDAIISIGIHDAAHVPTFVVQDLSFPHLRDWIAEHGFNTYLHDAVGQKYLDISTEWTTKLYRKVAGVFTMSKWDREGTVRSCPFLAGKVHALGAGANARVTAEQQPDDPNRQRTVMFIGRLFYGKAGDTVVEAVRRLRESMNVRLVVAGPKEWPMPGPIPDFVEYIGDAPTAIIEGYLAKSDVLAMPSRFEAYGIAIAEALCAGIPAVGRNAFAMPELIRDGETGVLIQEDSAEELCEALRRAITDPRIREGARAAAAEGRRYWSWDRVVDDMVRIVRQTLTSSAAT
jgi:glycosyltransferase involved in cell wall biosynthesis